nr:guanylate kinase-like [Lytechinus pictus]
MAEYIPRPCVFCGPSGSGKSTLIKQLMDEHKDTFGFSVNYQDLGNRMEFKMELAIANGEFLEHAQFSGNMYGTSKKAVQDVLATKRICILDIDVQGVKSIKETDLKPIYIFVKPPSIEVLEERLRGRKTDSEEAIQKRLATAIKELEYIDKQEPAEGSIYFIVNDIFERAYSQLSLILQDEINRLKSMKRHPQTQPSL